MKARIVGLIIFMTILAFSSIQNACASDSLQPSLIILPPANKTGSDALDWLSIGIQDSMTSDLWGVSSVRTRSINMYGNLMGLRLDLKRISNLDSASAVKLAQEAHVGVVWRGEYELKGTNTVIFTCWSMDAKTGELLHQQQETGPLSDIASMVSRMTRSLLAPSGISATKQEIDRIAKPKTTQPNAFEQNSRCFGSQILWTVRQRSMMNDKRGWIDACRKTTVLDPEYAEAYVNLGWALHTDGSTEAAFKAFTDAVTRKPYLLDGWMGLGYIHRARGNNGMALDAFQKAVAINGTIEWPREELKKLIAVADFPQVSGNTRPQSAVSTNSPVADVVLSSDEKLLFALTDHELLDIRVDAMKRIVRSQKTQALPFLKQMINKPDQAFEVLKLMVDISIPDSVPYLTEVLEKRITPDGSRLSGLSEQNILGVVQLIKRRSIDQATPVLIQTLHDKSAAVRESAALTLGDLGKQAAVEPLRKVALAEKNPQTRVSALVALLKLGDVESRGALKKMFSEGKDMNSINYATKLMKQRNIDIVDR